MSRPIGELNELIREWAKARKLDTADPARQFLKVMEEFGKELYPLVTTMEEPRVEEIIDAIGDTHVTLEILALQLGVVPFVSGTKEVAGLDNFGLADNMIVALGNIAECIAKDRNAAEYIGYAQWLNECISYSSIDYPPELCIEAAYNEIKDRKGEMRNGVFVKEEDL